MVLIAELAHALSGHGDLAGYAFLIIILWWARINGTLYHDLHGNNDIRTRVFTFLQMFTVASMAVFAHDAPGESSVGFALSYAAFQLILTHLWWRTGGHDPDHCPLSRPYVLAFLVVTLLFVVTVFLPEPWHIVLRALAVVGSLLLLLVTVSQGRRDSRIQEQGDRTTGDSPSAMERFGLLSIIVLGEVVAVVRGVAGHHHLG